MSPDPRMWHRLWGQGWGYQGCSRKQPQRGNCLCRVCKGSDPQETPHCCLLALGTSSIISPQIGLVTHHPVPQFPHLPAGEGPGTPQAACARGAGNNRYSRRERLAQGFIMISRLLLISR